MQIVDSIQNSSHHDSSSRIYYKRPPLTNLYAYLNEYQNFQMQYFSNDSLAIISNYRTTLVSNLYYLFALNTHPHPWRESNLDKKKFSEAKNSVNK